jgi:hypothetical protein
MLGMTSSAIMQLPGRLPTSVLICQVCCVVTLMNPDAGNPKALVMEFVSAMALSRPNPALPNDI